MLRHERHRNEKFYFRTKLNLILILSRQSHKCSLNVENKVQAINFWKAVIELPKKNSEKIPFSQFFQFY